MRCLRSRSTAFDEIWNDDAPNPSQPDGKTKISKFQNPRWRTAAILKSKNHYISEIVWPILTKFCMTAQ